MKKDESQQPTDSTKHSEKKETTLEQKTGQALQSSVAKEGFEGLNADLKHQMTEHKSERNLSLQKQIEHKGKASIGKITEHFKQSPEITDGTKVVVPGRSPKEVAEALQMMKDASAHDLKIGPGGKFHGSRDLLAESPKDSKSQAHGQTHFDLSSSIENLKKSSSGKDRQDLCSRLTDEAHKDGKLRGQQLVDVDEKRNLVKVLDPAKDRFEFLDKNFNKIESVDRKSGAKVSYGKDGNPSEVDYPDHSSRKFTQYQGKQLTEFEEIPAPGAKGALSVWRKNGDDTWDNLDKHGKPLSQDSTKIPCKIEINGEGVLTRTDQSVSSRFSDTAGFDYHLKHDLQTSFQIDGSKTSKNMDSGETWVLNPKPIEVRVPQANGTEKCYDLMHGTEISRDKTGKEISRLNARDAQKELSGTPLGEKIMRFMQPGARQDISDKTTASVEQKLGDSVVRVSVSGKSGSVADLGKATGWVATNDGQIVTAAHEVIGKNDPIISFRNEKGEWQRAAARVTKCDRENDIAILQLKPDDQNKIPLLKRALLDSSGKAPEGQIQAVGIPKDLVTLRPDDKIIAAGEDGSFFAKTPFQIKEAKGNITGHIDEANLENHHTKEKLDDAAKKAQTEATSAVTRETKAANAERTALNVSNQKEAVAKQETINAKTVANSKVEQAIKDAAQQKAELARREAEAAKLQHAHAAKDLAAAKAETANKQNEAAKAKKDALIAPVAKHHSNEARYEANYDNQKGMSGGPVYANGAVIGMTRGLVGDLRNEANANNANADIVVPVDLIQRVLKDTTGKYNYTGNENLPDDPDMTTQDFRNLSKK